MVTLKLQSGLSVGLLLLMFNAFSQKPAIGIGDLEKWPTLSSVAISSDGKYSCYIEKNLGTKLIIRSNIGSYIKEIAGAINPIFCGGSRKIAFLKADSLYLLDISSGRYLICAKANAFQVVVFDGIEYLISHSVRDDELTIWSFDSQPKIVFKNTRQFLMSPDNSRMILVRQIGDINAVDVYELKGKNTREIWRGGAIVGNYVFDDLSEKIAFFVKDTVNRSKDLTFYIWDSSDDHSKKMFSDATLKFKEGFELSQYGAWSIKFSQSGRYLYFSLKRSPKIVKGNSSFGVNVWSYTDPKLNPDQFRSLSENVFVCSYNLTTKKVSELAFENESIIPLPKSVKSDKFLIVEERVGDVNEWNWNASAVQKLYLVSTETGARTTIKDTGMFSFYYPELNPKGDKVVYFDALSKNYFSYDIQSGSRICVTYGINARWISYMALDNKYDNIYPFRNLGWLNDSTLLVKDLHDIWLLNISGKKTALNLTSTKNKYLYFSLAVDSWDGVDQKGILLLKCFNQQNKTTGFYHLDLVTKKLSKLVMDDYIYQNNFQIDKNLDSRDIVKASDMESYIIRRESATSFPNYFYTSDFKSFTKLSDLHPEERYNWLTVEQVKFKLENNHLSEGILYKPENFDSTKKYPVIITYYTKSSYLKNQYKVPSLSGGNINIPYFVSNGYLVFFIDIDFSAKVSTGRASLLSVLGAFNYLKAKPWVNSKKIGLSGHSFAGFQTDYLITHSKVFAAALSGAGVSNTTSSYGSVWPRDGFSKQGLFEHGYYRFAGPMWEKPLEYIRNSPVFYVKNVVTPLLMLHNTNDGSVHFSQGVEFFTGLRRLGKKVWLLQYDNEDHAIYSKGAKVDYTIRVKQFFDHYLRDSLPPMWMTKGIPASKKGSWDGYEQDSDITTPGTGLLNNSEKINMIKYSNLNQVTFF